MILEGRSGNVGNAEARFRFTGKERDTETGYDYFGARYYDARIGRFLSVDPKADTRVWLTPYHYARNNPLLYIDPDGQEEFKVTTRTFIPFASVLGFRGDNRGPSTSEDVSYRTSHSVVVESDARVSANPLISDDGGNAARTYFDAIGASAQGEGSFTTSVSRSDINNGDNASISFTGSATNPFDLTGAFSIDYAFQLTIVPGQDGTPTVTVTGSHDGFPAYEINVTGANGVTYQVYFNTPTGEWQVYKLLPDKDVKVEEDKK